MLDKRLAEQKKRRISERMLFCLALFFGGLGIYLGMFVFHHKTKKWYFQVLVPIFIFVNIYLSYLIFQAGLWL